MLADLAPKLPVVILSTENLCLLSAEKLRILAEAFKDRDVEVVYYLRNLNGFLPSHWQELVKHGSGTTFEEYLLERMTKGPDPDNHPDSFAHIANMNAAFGRENVRVFLDDNIVARGLDVYDEFLRHVLHVPPSALVEPGSVTKSFAPERTEMLWALNMLYAARHGKSPGYTLRINYVQTARQFETTEAFAAFRTAFAAHACTLALPEDFPAITVSNDRVLKAYGSQIENKVSDTQLFIPAKAKSTVFGSRYWLHAAGQAEYVTEILDSLPL